MSKILTYKEAEQYSKLLCEEYGFNAVTLDLNPKAPAGETHRLCNANVVKKTTGWWLWKKTKEITELDPVFVGPHWEAAVGKLEDWIETQVKPRVDKADRQREKLATLLLDEELNKK